MGSHGQGRRGRVRLAATRTGDRQGVVAEGGRQQGGDCQDGGSGGDDRSRMQFAGDAGGQSAHSQRDRLGRPKGAGHTHGVGDALALRHQLYWRSNSQREIEQNRLDDYLARHARIVCREVWIIARIAEGVPVRSAWRDVAAAPTTLLLGADLSCLGEESESCAAALVAHHEGEVDPVGCAAHQAHDVLGVVGPLDDSAHRDGYDSRVEAGLGDSYLHGVAQAGSVLHDRLPHVG